MKQIEPLLWSIALILTLALGIYAGWVVPAAYKEKDTELMDVRAALETAQASLADANIELAQNRATVVSWDRLASYYTERSSGTIQANGKRFNEDALTAAHRTLRFGTILILENLDNGKLSPVQIQDRGPAEWTGRTLDVSLAVAKRLGIVHQGVAHLRCYVLVDGRPSVGD